MGKARENGTGAEADIEFELQAAVAFFSSSWSEFLLPP